MYYILVGGFSETPSYTSYKPTLLIMGSLDAGGPRFDLLAMKHGNGTYIPLIDDFPIIYIWVNYNISLT